MENEYSFRAAKAGDKAAWLDLWAGYQAFYEVELPDEVTERSWERILDGKSPEMGTLLAQAPDGQIIGFLNYVTHNITWAIEPVCYMEDLFVTAEARGTGAAGGLIDMLTEMGRKAGWHRIYWHTARDNVPAQILYNKLAERTGWVRYDLDLDDGSGE